MSLFAVDGLSKSFGGVRAVREVGFGLDAGEMLALIGPNGAGKSTCFNVLTGQLAPDVGRVTFDGHAITGLSPQAIWRLGIGRTFQIAATFRSLTVRENVETALLSRAGGLRGFWRPAAGRVGAQAGALLARVGIAGLSARVCGTLAYGDLKRVELALALAGQPRLLLMDEPTAGMAPAERRALMALVASLARAEKIAVLFTEHDMEAVFSHADRVIVLDRGAKIAEGPPAAIRADARVRAVYLGKDAVEPRR
ncbi:MAG: ATP-binding cassette domain-containing protein [Alphaproteobacteria bacterium]|nr:ATP-binding cassette domain-containing protein [Alphaproteobacteria bacterium]